MVNTEQPSGLPIGVSANIDRNVFCHSCKVTSRRERYAVCLFKIDARKHGALPPYWDMCSPAIHKKTCPAIAMRKEEVEKGQAIYFDDKAKYHPQGLAEVVDRSKRTLDLLGERRETTTAPAAPVPVKSPAPISQDYMADALNKAIADEQKAKKVVTTPTPAPAPGPKIELRPGETMLEAARRVLAQRKSA